MSITYHLIPVDNTMKSPEFTQWFGRPLPENLRPGRNPQVAEFAEALRQIPEFEIRTEGPPEWAIYRNGELYLNIGNIESGTFYLTFLELPGFRSAGDGDGVIKIVSKLPPECGAFVMITDWDDPELVVAGVGRFAG